MTDAVVKPKIGNYHRHLLICTGPRCSEDGASQALFDSLGGKFKAAGLDAGELRVKRSRVSCFAACKGGPIVCVQPDGTWYYNVTSENMDRIIDDHLCNGKRVEELVFHQAGATDFEASRDGRTGNQGAKAKDSVETAPAYRPSSMANLAASSLPMKRSE